MDGHHCLKFEVEGLDPLDDDAEVVSYGREDCHGQIDVGPADPKPHIVN
ncbi:MAG: hypothetical protein JKY49_03560 [Cohaesibacteraceae bacterium]|nr:hypothetical protein [Cohaesibacteraceae bacterium]MBL4876304.1 hypothetical protein [Cohaesibacteraceae bacterium]